MAALHMQLDVPVPKGPLGPFNSTICLRTAPKRPPKAPEFVHIGRRQPKTKNISWATWLKTRFASAPNPPARTHFWWFPPLKIALTDAYTPVPRPSGLRQAAGGSPKRWVPKWVNKVHRVQKKKGLFSKNDPRPHGMPKEVFLARFELMVAYFGPPALPKCLENGLFWDKKWVQNVFFQK